MNQIFQTMVRSHSSALIKQPFLNKAKNDKDQRKFINSENDYYIAETWKEKNVIVNGFQSILKNK